MTSDEEQPQKKKPWFDKISPQLLERAGPGKSKLNGVDVTTGGNPERPAGGQTEDVYSKAQTEKQRR